MIINSQRTIYGLELQADMLISNSYTPKPNTTLNEKFNVMVNEPIGSDTHYGIKYLAIGVGGELVAPGTNSYSYSQHSPTDAVLFEHIPFVMREIRADLSDADKAKYRMRVTRTINNIEYALYYLKAVKSTDITTGTYNITLSSSNTSSLSKLDTNTSKFLNPVPRSINYKQADTTNYISKIIKLRFELNPTELQEINNVLDIVYGLNNTKAITEIGVCGGLDVTVNGITEAINTQIYYHVGTSIDTRLNYDPTIGYLRAIEMGGSETLYL